MMYYNTSTLLPSSFDYVNNNDDVDDFKIIKAATKKDVDWTSKYLSSDHHDDRQIQNMEHYQIVTGQKYPEFAAMPVPTSTNYRHTIDIDEDQFATEGPYTRLALPTNTLSVSLSPPGRGGGMHHLTTGIHTLPSSSLQAARRPSFSSSGSVKGSLTVASTGRSREVSPFSSSHRPRSHTFTFQQGQQGQGQGQSHNLGVPQTQQSAFYRTTSLPADDLVTCGDSQRYQSTRHLPLSDARRKLRDVLRKSRLES